MKTARLLALVCSRGSFFVPLSWLIGLIFCVVKWLYCFVCVMRTSCTSWIPISSGVNKSVTQNPWKLLCLLFLVFMFHVVDHQFPLPMTRYTPRNQSENIRIVSISIIMWKKLPKKYHSLSLWVRLSAVFRMSWLG